MPSNVHLIVGDVEMTTWQSYAIESDLLVPADAWSFRAANPGGRWNSPAITKGKPARVIVDDELLMTGIVDDVDRQGDGSGSTIEITGRDLAGYLVDCSAEVTTFQNPTLLDLAKKVSAPWGIQWRLQSGISPQAIRHVKIEPGESPWDVVERYAKQSKLIVWMEPDGTAVIGRPDYKQPVSFHLYRFNTSPDSRKNNILSGGCRQSGREQYSTLKATCQSSAGGLFDDGGTFRVEAVDTTISRRPKHITLSAKSVKAARTEIEGMVEQGKFQAEELNYQLKGFYNSDVLLAAGKLAEVVDEVAGVDGTYLMTRRRLSDQGDGQRAEVALHPAGVWLV